MNWYPTGTLAKPFLPVDLTEAELAFGAANKIASLLPPAEDIPKEFIGGYTKWNDFFNTYFYGLAKDLEFYPVEGIDPNKAWRHVSAIIASYAPKHEYKEAAVAYLLSLWYKDVKYGKKDLTDLIKDKENR